MNPEPSALLDGQTGALNTVNVHQANSEIATELISLATARGLAVRRNNTNYGRYDGYHAYVLLRPGMCRDFSIRSRACVEYSVATHSRSWRPSIRGERGSIRWLIRWLKDNQHS